MNYFDNKPYYQEYEKKRSMLKQRVKARSDYQKTEAGKKAGNNAKRKWTKNNPIKRGANHMVNNAVRDGRLEKKYSCSECGKTDCRIHGHHDDYAKPLEVRWICSKCHKDWHDENGEGLNG